MVKFWKVVRKTLLIVTIVVVGLVGIAATLTYVYEDDIKAMAIKEVNKNLQAKVIITGSDINLTFFSSFPNMAIQFQNFKIMEPTRPDSVLAQVGRLNFEFSPFDFVNKEYHISRVFLEDATVKLRIDSKGNPNYLILKPDTAKPVAGQASPLDVKLKHIKLKNVKILYADAEHDRQMDVQINNAVFAGSFTDAQYSLSADADLVAENIRIGKQALLSHKPISITAALDMDNSQKKYMAKEFKLKIGKSTFSANGCLSKKGQDFMTDIALKGEDANIQTIVSLLPQHVSDMFKDYQGMGEVSFNGRIKGMAGKNETPAIDFQFNIANGTFKDDKRALGLEAVNLKGSYTNGNAHTLQTSSLHIDKFGARLNGRDLDMHLFLENFSDPYADIYLKSNINLKDLKNFAAIPGIDSMAGDMTIDAGFKGRLGDLRQYGTVSKTKLNGKMTLNHVSIKPTVQQYAYKNLTGEFETNGNDLSIDDFSGTFGHTDFELGGLFKNLASFIFLPNQKLVANTSLVCHNINIDDFVHADAKPQNGKPSPTHFDFPAFMAFDFALKVDKLTWGKFIAENVTGQVQMDGKAAYFQNISMKTMDGQVQLNGNIQDVGPSLFKATAHANIKAIDVKICFTQMGNFGQTYFTDKYIKGKLDAQVDYTSNWGKDLTVDLNSIMARADITIFDGEIHGFPQFIALGKYLKVKSLDDVYFSEYSNTIFIKNGQVEIPKMDIKSSAMNMSLSGTHTFQNVMDYKLKLNMSQLLFGNKKSYEDEFGEVEVDDNGGMNVFLTMTGPADNYKIKYDTKSSVKNMGKGLQDEKAEMQKIFKSNSPNAKPGEDLNAPSTEYHLEPSPGDSPDKTNPDEDTGTPAPKKTSRQDSARKKAFENFKKKF